MSKLVHRIAAVAALALAATPIIGLTAAHAGERAPAPAPVRVKVGDLRLADPVDAQEFARRAHLAGARSCNEKGLRGISAKACVKEFHEDLRDAMTERQAADLKLARRAGAKVELALN